MGEYDTEPIISSDSQSAKGLYKSKPQGNGCLTALGGVPSEKEGQEVCWLI